MALHTRPNGSTYFTDDPAVDPATGVKIDADLNALTATVNALDNANIAATPKIAGSKVELSTSGYLPLTGGDLSAVLNHPFEGIFRTMRTTANGKIYEYRGSDGAIWGMSYNTSWVSGAWVGRDKTDICAVLKMESDGLHYYHAVSAASGVVPTFIEKFHAGLTGITISSLLAPTAGDWVIHENNTLRQRWPNTYDKVKEIKVGQVGVYRVRFTIKESGAGSAGIVYGKIYVNGTTYGTERSNTTTTPAVYSEDVTTTAVGDLIQIYSYSSSNSNTADTQCDISDMVISVAEPIIAGTLYGY